METNVENSDIASPQAENSTCNISYAAVLSKGKSESNDASNNNPSVNDIVNGNDRIPHSVTDDSVMFEDSFKSSVDVNSADQSQNDSFEDAEDSQINDLSSIIKSSDSRGNLVQESTSADSVVTINSSGSQANELVVTESQTSVDFSDSGDESDLEDTDDLDALNIAALKWKFRSGISECKLPDTVTVLETSQGSKVFVVGTAHFSTESQEDVAKTIRAVQPDVVMIELCKSRVNILSLDDATILEESKNMNFQKIKAAIDQNGFLQGVLYLLLLSMSAHLTKELGMAPGGEFRRAFAEAKQVPGCLVHLGDRPIHITLQRAWARLSWWQKLRIAWYILRSKEPISKEEVERCKQKDLLEEMLAEMTGEFPELSRVFVKERDIYLTYSLQMSAVPVPSANVCVPSYVVGVVGIGHVPGIKENWGKITEKDIPPILSVPEPSMSSKVIRKTIKLSLIGLGIYGLYKIFPKSLIPTRSFPFITLPLSRG